MSTDQERTHLSANDFDDDALDVEDLDDLVAIDEVNRSGESRDFDEFCRDELGIA